MIDSISLDGLTGSGKTAVGIMLAEALDYFYFEPQMLFNVLVPPIVDTNISISNTEHIANLLNSLNIDLTKIKHRRRSNRFVKRKEAAQTSRLMHFYKFEHPQAYQITINEKLASSKIEELKEQLGFESYWEFFQWHVETINCLILEPHLHHILVEKMKPLSESYGLVMGGDEVSPSLLLHTKNKFILTADQNTRNTRIVDRGRQEGAIWDKSEIMPFTKKRDDADLSRPSHLQFPKDALKINTESKTVFEIAKTIYPALELKKPITSTYDWQF